MLSGSDGTGGRDLDLRTAEGTHSPEVSALDTNVVSSDLPGEHDLGTNFSNTPGAGAVDLVTGVLTFLNGQIIPGFNVVAEKSPCESDGVNGYRHHRRSKAGFSDATRKSVLLSCLAG